ncbi:hypothetical protein BGZ93_003923, partial [Podila epicladia]
MSCTFTPRALPLSGTADECFRINLKYLDLAAIRSLCCDFYSALASEFDQFIDEAWSGVQRLAASDKLDSLCLEERQGLVDHLDSCISSAILTAAEEACGSYKPSAVRASSDKLFASLPTAPTLSAAIRTFKRACRSKTVTLTSRDPDISPADDAALHYKAVFTQTDPRFIPPAQSPYRGVTFVPEIDFDMDFTLPALLNFWRKYPTHVSGGEDGIHIRLLRTLMHTELPHQTLKLFKMCCLL